MESIFDIAADLHTPVSAFLRLAPLRPRYLLESVEAGHAGRYSFIGFGDCRRIPVDELTDDRSAPRSGDVLDGLRRALREAPVCEPADTRSTPFTGGLVGVAAFDLVRRLYKLPPAPHASAVGEGMFVATDSILVFDHLTRRMALLHAGPAAERVALRAEVIEILRGPLDDPRHTARHQAATPSMTREGFMAGVERVKERISAGDVYQLVLSIRFSGETEVEPFAAYRALRLLNPSPYMYFLDLGDSQVVGSSPEALARLKGGRAELRPIAGTRRRGDTEEEDRRLERELLGDPKEAAEHVMLVDLARNDLGRTARPGSVVVEPFRSIERYSHVMHMVSGVSGDVRRGLDAFDLFAAAFPAGTVTGAPKLKAIEIIDELEPVSRGLYSGSVGYFGHGGSMDQAITIRTIVFTGEGYSFQAGAGIVADSDPAAEHQEVLSKAAAMEAALEMAKEGL
ncbi:MAG TPA: anthranilate synthase component I family protein [Acidimicrobiia bacterium]|jgi:anthranilate synthase component 1|nr:anthranilate synthase component I family protein [Acidimicrobiia bacterium]